MLQKLLEVISAAVCPCSYISVLEGSTSAFYLQRGCLARMNPKDQGQKKWCLQSPSFGGRLQTGVCWIFSVLQTACRVHFLNIFTARFSCEISARVNISGSLGFNVGFIQKWEAFIQHLLLGLAAFLQLGKSSGLFVSHWKYHSNVCPVGQEGRWAQAGLCYGMKVCWEFSLLSTVISHVY